MNKQEKTSPILRPSRWLLWLILRPIFPYLRHYILALPFLKHSERQKFIIGHLANGRTYDELLEHLKTQGFGNHFIAWIDKDEKISLRKFDGKDRQYHLRIFKDGEIRGHNEYTPESHPIWHLQEVDLISKREDFQKFLNGWIVPAPISEPNPEK
ncbi:MAG: hypothetical protein ACD_76C00067G0004 [uncultured bacterium]|nr:MAG: hypothetical protein ACD_76C00067G0004 [uncultured bacterium]HBD04936.1 hypothetical protein [Candidatus Uhrbacteria bacterium]